MKSYYEKNFEGGYFVCLVCCVVIDKKMLKRFKYCYGFVLYFIKILKIVIRVYKVFVRFVCKLFGWEFDYFLCRIVKGGVFFVEFSVN